LIAPIVFTQGILHISLCNKNTPFFVPGKIPTFLAYWGLTYRKLTEMGINFALKRLSGFQTQFSFFRSLNRFLPVSAVIDQSIRDNFHYIIHAESYQIMPGFVYLRIKVTSQ